MRCGSPSRVTLGGLLLGGGAVFLLLAILSMVGLPDRGGSDAAGAGLPSKSNRYMQVEVEGGDLKSGVRASVQAAAHFTEDDLEAFSAAADELLGGDLTASEVALEMAREATGVASGGKADLTRALLEKAAQLSLHAEDPWKNLVLVALAYQDFGDQEAMQKWFDHAVRLATDPDDPQHTSAAMRDVVRGLLVARLYGQAESLATRIPELAYRELSRAELAASLAGRRRFAEAIGLAAGLTGEKARGTAMRGIAQAQARAGNLPEAITTSLQIANAKYRDDALLRVALVQAGRGDAAGAASVVGQIGNERTRELAQVRLAEYQVRSAPSSQEALLSLMNDPFLRDESLRRLVEVEVERKNYDEARAAMFRIESRAERAQAMECLVSLQVRSGDLNGALSQAQSIDMEDSRTRALQSVAVAEVGSSGVRTARSVATLIVDPEQRDIAYRRVAERAAVLGHYREAGHTILNINSPVESASARASVAKTRARRGSFGPARLLIQDAERDVAEIPQRKKQARALSMLAEAYAEMKDGSTAMTTAAGIDDSAMRDRTYQVLSRKFASRSDVKLAEESAQSIAKDTTRERALDDMAKVIAAKTRATEALRRVKDFESRRQQVRFLLAVAQRI